MSSIVNPALNNDQKQPAHDIVPVTPNDSTDLPDGLCRGLLIASGGTLKIHVADGTARTLTVPAGIIPVYAKRVWATGTSATGIAAIY
jgi:hypothetical protein